MNQQTERKGLLSDVLAEGGSARFREQLLTETLRQARGRRRRRQMRRTAVVAGALGFIAFGVWQMLPRPGGSPEPTANPYRLVHTERFPEAGIVNSRRLPVDRLVASSPNANLVRTTAVNEPFQAITDEQLLALVSPRPAVLVRVGPHRQELIFADPADQNEFPVN